jgi:uncharacterized membrane protein YeaQ/YmgE (transglycosylase-associated protein family)
MKSTAFAATCFLLFLTTSPTTGRAMRGGGFGLFGDLLFGILGAIGANFVVSYFSLFDLVRYGLIGEIIVAIIGAILLVVLVHLLTGLRGSRPAA